MMAIRIRVYGQQGFVLIGLLSVESEEGIIV